MIESITLRQGTLHKYVNFASRYVAPRNVDVWLPPDYAKSRKSYAVLYMHDGQNLFDNSLAYGGESWDVHMAAARLMEEGKIPGAIIVGMWNTSLRWQEYMPQKPFEECISSAVQNRLIKRFGSEPIADRYLRFITKELKLFIDQKYRTLTDRSHTAIMGSSMGALISLYAISRYPKIFGASGSVSIHWPLGGYKMVKCAAESLPDPKTHRLYFDYGTLGLDADYEKYQNKMDAFLRKAGYVQGETCLSQKFEGADHNERSWRERVHIPLEFLLRETN